MAQQGSLDKSFSLANGWLLRNEVACLSAFKLFEIHGSYIEVFTLRWLAGFESVVPFLLDLRCVTSLVLIDSDSEGFQERDQEGRWSF